ncbi:MAG: hypothetical protein Q7S22_08610 [Candidatus Micrarchaeota archaeon]|nr:hypothetical protein [Candidatus Micrarchaeota archaeon]
MTGRVIIVACPALRQEIKSKRSHGQRLAFIRSAKTLGTPYLEELRFIAREGETHNIHGEEKKFSLRIVKVMDEKVELRVKIEKDDSKRIILHSGELVQIFANGEDYKLEFAGFLKFYGVTNSQLERNRGIPRIRMHATHNGVISRCEILIEEFVPHRVTVGNISITLAIHDVCPMLIADDLLTVQRGDSVEREMKLDYVVGNGLEEGSIKQGNREMIYRDGNAEFQLEFVGIATHGKIADTKKKRR